MCSGPKLYPVPALTAVSTLGTPTARLCSVRVPCTTATAPEEMSWSCQPVSFCGVQQISQTSTWASRCSDT